MSSDEGARLAVVVTLWVKPGYEAEFLRLLQPVLDAMRHEPTFINGRCTGTPRTRPASCSTRPGRTGPTWSRCR